MQRRSFSNAYNKQLGSFLPGFDDDNYFSDDDILYEESFTSEDDIFYDDNTFYEGDFFYDVDDLVFIPTPEVYVPSLGISIPSDTNAAIGVLNSLSDEEREIAMKSIIADGRREDIFAHHKEIKQATSFFDNFASGLKATIDIAKDLAPAALTTIKAFRDDPISSGNSQTQLQQQLLAQTQAQLQASQKNQQLLTQTLLANNRQQTPTHQTTLPPVVVQKEEKKEEKGFWKKYGAPVAIGGVSLLALGMVLITTGKKK